MTDTYAAECEDMARSHGLRYGSDGEPGIRRRRCGRGFRYLAPNGDTPTGEMRSRIDELVIPPAWTDVWISLDPMSHLQATGRDDRDRKQYLYHPQWRQIRDEAKFDQLAAFSTSLIEVRKRTHSDLRGKVLDRRRATAAVVALLDTTLIRVGNERYAAENDTFGATTLEPRHVTRFNGGLRLDFTGKSNVERSLVVNHPGVVRVIEESLQLRQPQLFCFADVDGTIRDLTSGHVNDYLADTAGETVTAKSFRTWGATALAVDHLCARTDRSESFEARTLAAVDAAAEALGNTRAVCRSCYVAPAVAEAARTDELDSLWKASRAGRWRSRAESATAKLLYG